MVLTDRWSSCSIVVWLQTLLVSSDIPRGHALEWGKPLCHARLLLYTLQYSCMHIACRLHADCMQIDAMPVKFLEAMTGYMENLCAMQACAFVILITDCMQC